MYSMDLSVVVFGDIGVALGMWEMVEIDSRRLGNDGLLPMEGVYQTQFSEEKESWDTWTQQEDQSDYQQGGFDGCGGIHGYWSYCGWFSWCGSRYLGKLGDVLVTSWARWTASDVEYL